MGGTRCCVGRDRLPSVGQWCLVANRISAVSLSRAASLARSQRILRHVRPHPRSTRFSSNEEFARRCDRCSTRQSHRARSDQCPRDCRWGSVEIIMGSSAQGKTICPHSPSGGEIGRVPTIHRTCHEVGPVGVRSPREANADDCSFVSSESCWRTIWEDAWIEQRPLSTWVSCLPLVRHWKVLHWLQVRKTLCKR